MIGGMAEHRYELTVEWTGDRGTGTRSYTGYGRDHIVSAEGLPKIRASADPSFRGEDSRWNPEQLFVASLSQCHMLWFLHLCADSGVVVLEYVDHPVGTMVTGKDGRGEFTEVLLRPAVAVAGQDQVERTWDLHDRAHEMCFISRSVKCPVRHEPTAAAH
jgi:organic hydroperoxide reductase OsmC/OhrA